MFPELNDPKMDGHLEPYKTRESSQGKTVLIQRFVEKSARSVSAVHDRSLRRSIKAAFTREDQ